MMRRCCCACSNSGGPLPSSVHPPRPPTTSLPLDLQKRPRCTAAYVYKRRSLMCSCMGGWQDRCPACLRHLPGVLAAAQRPCCCWVGRRTPHPAQLLGCCMYTWCGCTRPGGCVQCHTGRSCCFKPAAVAASHQHKWLLLHTSTGAAASHQVLISQDGVQGGHGESALHEVIQGLVHLGLGHTSSRALHGCAGGNDRLLELST